MEKSQVFCLAAMVHEKINLQDRSAINSNYDFIVPQSQISFYGEPVFIPE